MSTVAESFDKIISELEAAKSKIERDISQLRAMRAAHADAPQAVRVARQPQDFNTAFARKYDTSARELILERLGQAQEALTVGDAHNALRRQGFDFKKQTVAVTLKKLHQDGLVRRVKAPKGSGYSYAFSTTNGAPR